ncbi:MAG: NADH-quinone oxidoreductase subunit C [Gemmatales bacterium]|nr:NADH-quinone oxidoreductase subunit C [Gemmatales bacterium]MCS7159960.1 NADH-quinone oxidoreductase subunit C [Gemmatales bacterium]MDW8175159.1 NADH-quinone oxidoreductase subunit C [Gemmatales bacterium]MDW8222057.1 NADH-quinone oxidoreductase subunit C [Gemmatales bacterium]
MGGAEIIAILVEKFGPRIQQTKPDAIDPYVVVDAGDLVDVCRFLRDDPRLQFDMLNCITGVDYCEPDPAKAPKAGFEPHLEVVYHLSSFVKRHRFVVKVLLPRWKDNVPGQLPEVPTVTSIWPAANWHERETYDLVGVYFVGHPDLRRILLAEDWEGHPLRKDYVFPLEYHGIRGR